MTLRRGINVEDSVSIEIGDCKNSKVLVGCFYGAPGVERFMKNSERCVRMEDY